MTGPKLKGIERTGDIGKEMTAEQRKMYINGEWVDASGGRTFDVFNPANGETCYQVADAA